MYDGVVDGEGILLSLLLLLLRPPIVDVTDIADIVVAGEIASRHVDGGKCNRPARRMTEIF